MFALFTPAPRPCDAPLAHPSPALDLRAMVGAAAWARLPAAVQRRFGTAHADVAYEGQMDLRCSLVGHVYAALTRVWGGPLTHINTTALPATVRVSGNGCGGVVWERCFHTGTESENGAHNAADRTVRSTKELGADALATGCFAALLVQRVGAERLSKAIPPYAYPAALLMALALLAFLLIEGQGRDNARHA